MPFNWVSSVMSRTRNNAVRNIAIFPIRIVTPQILLFDFKPGSCVAFANLAAIETCFKKKTGVFGEFSETKE